MIIYDCVKYKTLIRGYWQDKNKIFRDYITICNTNFNIEDKFLLARNPNELAIFYIKDNQAFIISQSGEKTILNHNIIFTIPKKQKELTRLYIKECIKQYGGVTLFDKGQNFILSVWYK